MDKKSGAVKIKHGEYKKMKQKTTTKKTKTIVEKIAKDLFSLLGSNALIQIEEDKANEAILVKVDAGDETGLLIGKHGETISSIQIILGMMLQKELGEWTRIVVDVGDWREKQEERLRDLANQIAEKAIDSGQPQPVYNLSPSQRRVIHMVLAENKSVNTESEGEGSDRYLVVKPKTEK